MNFKILPLGDEHISEAVEVIVNSFTVDGHTPDQYNIQRIRKRIIASFEEGDNAPKFIVAVKDEKVIGVAGSQKMDFASKTWTLFLQAVSDDFRGQGIGTSLVHARIEIIKEQMGHRGGRIMVSTKHKKRFERLGFVSVDYDSPLGLHLMLLHIGPSGDFE